MRKRYVIGPWLRLTGLAPTRDVVPGKAARRCPLKSCAAGDLEKAKPDYDIGQLRTVGQYYRVQVPGRGRIQQAVVYQYKAAGKRVPPPTLVREGVQRQACPSPGDQGRDR
jgi:hypothetical protein